MRRAREILTLLVACACVSGTAAASESVSLRASLTPERLGQGTTIGFDIQITAPAGQVPPPLTGVEVRYPNNLGIALSGLGLETCTAAALHLSGTAGCPVDSRMGYGSAIADVPFGPTVVSEGAKIAAFRAPDQEGHLAFFFYTESMAPVFSQLVLPGLLLAAHAPFGGVVNVSVPLVPTVPEGADVSVVQLRSTLGPEHITYTEEVHGRIVTYEPKGILLPDQCPRGGFPFAATLSFLDGSRASARTAVRCPSRRASPRRSKSARTQSSPQPSGA